MIALLMSPRVICIISIALCNISCSTLTDKSNIYKIYKDNQVASANSLWYIGSNENFDYFYHCTPLLQKEYKVKIFEIDIKDRFKKTNARTKWTQIFPPMELDFKNKNINIILEEKK